jgi:hypothetical protein
MQQSSQSYDHDKGRERTIVRTLYRSEKIAFMLYGIYIAFLFVVLLLSWILQRTALGNYLLSDAIPWRIILPISLLFIIVFPIADTFIQAREERWFARYGTTITTKVKGMQEVKSRYAKLFPKWRWLQDWILEYHTQLEWTHPDTSKTYTYLLRVRDQIMPTWGTNLSVLIDYDDPNYYLKQDIKDASLRF